MRPTTPWYLKAMELLADGEWHDGQEVLREAGKLITPGIAQRQTERLRVAGGKAPAERIQPLSIERQIRSGKNNILTEMVRMRVTRNTWETDPAYPFGSMFDPDKPWRVRQLRGAVVMSIPQVAERLGVATTLIRRLIYDKQLPAHNVGQTRRAVWRILRSDLPLYEKAVDEFNASHEERISDRNTRAATQKTGSNIARYLAEELGPSTDSPLKRVRKLVWDVKRLRAEYARLNAENANLRQQVDDLRAAVTPDDHPACGPEPGGRDCGLRLRVAARHGVA